MDEWASFLDAELSDTRKAYKAKPSFLKRDRKAEQSVRQDYADRELLELVQNAADAAAETGGDGRVRIVVSPEGLLVANTGEPFRDTGVESLLTAHLSDKPQRKIALIGAKGLGFRSILNWSFEPIILSGALRLAFSEEHAIACVHQLANDDERLAKLVRGNAVEFAPILPFPMIGDEVDRLINPAAPGLLAEAERLRASGYDTVVAAPFRNRQSFSRAVSQAIEFEPHFLLFVPALAQIDVEVEGYAARRWIKALSGDLVTLEISTDTENRVERWICRNESGDAPPGEDAEGAHRFEAVVALRVDQINAAGRLHCFFPTNVILPLPALFHGTFELASNRKQLRDGSAVNVFVLRKLATLYAETLADLLAGKRIPSAISYLLNDRTYSPELAAFEKQLFETAKQLPIIPTLGGEHVRAQQTSLGPAGSTDFFPHRLFPTFARHRNYQERELLGKFGVSTYEAGAALQVLSVAELSLDERADLVVGIAKNLPSEHHNRKFLIDEHGHPIPPRSTCFPPPTGGRLPAPPDWARKRFVHPELWDRLVQRFGSTRRDVIHRLTAFGVQEYNLDGLARALVQQAENLIRRNPEREPRTRREVLSVLQRLHARESIPAKFPPVKVKVLAQSGVWRPADELHLSAGYGIAGRINQALYDAYPSALIATPELQGIDVNAQEASAFFSWIGVHQLPREVVEVSPDASRADMMNALPETFLVTDGSRNQEIERTDIRWGQTARFQAKLVDHLDSILATAPSESILAWIARDPRLDTAVRHFTPRFEAQKNNAYFREYEGDFPDLVKARIRRSPWLVCTDGEKRAPEQLLRDPFRLESLFARPAQPEPELSAAFGLDHALWTKGLANAGVAATLQDVPEKDIYRLLLDLPDRDLPPEVVKRFYLQILEREQFRVEAAEAEAARFFTEGRVQCRIAGRVEWVPVVEAFYADRDGSLVTARGHLALMDLPSRRNATNVTARFGVSPLSRSQVTVRVSSSAPASADATALVEHRLESALPFIRAYRGLIAPDSSALRRLERLRLRVSAAVQTELSVGDEIVRSSLDCWSHILDGDELYVVIDENLTPPQMMMMAAEAIGDGLSDLFEIQSGAEIVKLLGSEGNEIRKLLLVRMLPNFQPHEIDSILLEPIEDSPETVNFDLALVSAANDDSAPTNEAAQKADEQLHTTEQQRDPLGSAPDATSRSGGPSEETRHETTAGEGGQSELGGTGGPSVPATVIITLIENAGQGENAKAKIDLRIHHGYGGGGSGGSGQRDPYRPTDAEGWAKRFEEEQGRWPISVAHVQGRDGLGCDLLSFNSGEELDVFLKEGDLRTVSRFIEVKSGGIHLTENETASAKKHKQRYYVYRVIFEDGGRLAAKLTMINDPLSYASALARELRIDIEDVADRATFMVTAAGTPVETALDDSAATTAPALVATEI